MLVWGFLLVKDWVACDLLWPEVMFFVGIYLIVNRISLKALEEFG